MKPAWMIAYGLLTDLCAIDPAPPSKSAEPTSTTYLKWMCNEIINHKSWDIDKAHRWIGYIQGVMCAKGWSTVDAERDRVRQVKDDDR